MINILDNQLTDFNEFIILFPIKGSFINDVRGLTPKEKILYENFKTENLTF